MQEKLVRSFKLSTQFGDWELPDLNVGYHEKYMNGGNTGLFKKNSVCSSTYPHENSGATSVYIEKATYQMNTERRTGVPEFMSDRIII